jgi:hypothetical protein
MKTLNIHSRVIDQPLEVVSLLLDTLASTEDTIWPYENWPEMKFKHGLKEGSKGGHGMIRYTIEKYIPKKLIEFRFSKPVGFNGIHKLEILERGDRSTEIRHTIDAKMEGIAIMTWALVIRPLHDALLEDAFDKVENRYLSQKKRSEWSNWVRFLRRLLGA